MRALTTAEGISIYWAVQNRVASAPDKGDGDDTVIRNILLSVMERAAGALEALPGKPHLKRLYALRGVLPGSAATALAVGEELAAARLKGGIPVPGLEPGADQLRTLLQSSAGSVDGMKRATAEDLILAEVLTEVFPLFLPEATRRIDFAILWLLAEGLPQAEVARVVGTYRMNVQRRSRVALNSIAAGLLALWPDIFSHESEVG
ncbi:hypothetical protein ACJ4V0_15835 [Phreatobacter sp. HK31-P]